MNNLRKEDLAEAGAMAGLVGGIGMAMVLMIRSSIAGLGFWNPMQIISTPFFGVESILGGFWPGAVGLTIHLVAAASLGAVFGAFLRPERRPISYLWQGIAYSAALWAISTFILLPGVNKVMSDRMALTPAWWFFSYLVFGSIVGSAAYFQSRAQRLNNVRNINEKLARERAA